MWGLSEQWQVTIGSTVLSFIGGILLQKFSNRKPNIVYYVSHMSDFRVPPAQEGQQPVHLYTHTLVVHNDGKAPATNLEVVHFPLSDNRFWWRIFPDVPFNQDRTPDNGLILRFPRLLPGHSINISYLYMYPFRVETLHNYVTSSETPGVVIQILPVRRTPKWLQLLLLWMGLLGVIYFLQLVWAGFVALIQIIIQNAH